jgi:hypothetical protein
MAPRWLHYANFVLTAANAALLAAGNGSILNVIALAIGFWALTL